jgi:hypothetical protein
MATSISAPSTCPQFKNLVSHLRASCLVAKAAAGFNLVWLSHSLGLRLRFMGNSSAAIMDGEATLYFLRIPGESYTITFPTAYARGTRPCLHSLSALHSLAFEVVECARDVQGRQN